jgi:hypothetical protein
MESSTSFFLWLGPEPRPGSIPVPTRVPQLLTTAFASGFVRHSSVPLLLLDRFPDFYGLGYPGGGDRPAIRPNKIRDKHVVFLVGDVEPQVTLGRNASPDECGIVELAGVLG